MTSRIVTRQAQLDSTRADAKQRRVPAVLSSEFPVQRDGYREVLLHTPQAVDLSRAPLPLIESHDRSQLPLGRVENLRLSDGKLRGDLVFGTSARANEIWPDVQAGIIQSLSIGYEIKTEQPRGQTIEATRWAPFEASLVSVPADPTAGTFRSHPMTDENITPIHDDGAERPSRSQRRALANDRGLQEQAAQDERMRAAEIMAMCQHYAKAPGVTEYCQRAIAEGHSVAEARGIVLEHLLAHGRRQDALSVYPASAIRGMSDAGAQRFSITRAIAAVIDPRIDAGYERECSQEMARKLGRNPDGFYLPLGQLHERVLDYAAGQATVPPEYLPGNFIEALRARSFVMRLGARVINDLVGNVSIPRLAASSTTAWIAGDGADGLTASQPTLDNIQMTPKTVGALTVISRKMVLQGMPAAESLIRDDFAQLIATELDKAAISGTGVSNQPRGILNVAGIGAGTYPLAGPDFASVVAMEGALMAANADQSGIAYLTTPTLAAQLKAKEKSTGSGQFVWNAGAERGTGEMGGLPAYASSNMPLDNILLGNFSDLLMGMWGALDISVDPNYDFAKGSIAVRIFASVDFAVRHPASFVAYTRGSV
jgi:HK97 family phage major capsid protein